MTATYVRTTARPPLRRLHPCVVCHAPDTACRIGTRCPNCRDELYLKHQADASRRRSTSRLREQERQRVEAAAAPKLSPWYETDSAVQTYRAEKARRDARHADEMTATDRAIEEARLILKGEADNNKLKKRSA